MIVNHTLSYLPQGRKRLGEAQTRVVTGRQLLCSSDNPAQVERAMTLASELRMVQKQTTNLKTSRDWLSGTDSALDQLNDLVIEALNVALRGMNDTFSEASGWPCPPNWAKCCKTACRLPILNRQATISSMVSE
jgi:flagellar hook-associated protein 3 FlgL